MSKAKPKPTACKLLVGAAARVYRLAGCQLNLICTPNNLRLELREQLPEHFLLTWLDLLEQWVLKASGTSRHPGEKDREDTG